MLQHWRSISLLAAPCNLDLVLYFFPGCVFQHSSARYLASNDLSISYCCCGWPRATSTLHLHYIFRHGQIWDFETLVSTPLVIRITISCWSFFSFMNYAIYFSLDVCMCSERDPCLFQYHGIFHIQTFIYLHTNNDIVPQNKQASLYNWGERLLGLRWHRIWFVGRWSRWIWN